MVALDDVVVALAAGISVTCLIVIVSLLSRYRAVVREQTKSADLAKNLWDAMNARLTTQDTRIVDLMARFEVYSTRRGPLPPTAQNTLPPAPPAQPVASRAPELRIQPSQPLSQAPLPASQAVVPKETQVKILTALLTGPKTSPQLREVHGLTREHNARLLKALYQQGLVVRNSQNKPYVYEITDAGRRYLGAP